MKMKGFLIQALISGLTACSGEIPVDLKPRINQWKIRTNQKINQLEIGISIFAFLCFLATGLFSAFYLSKVLCSRKKTRYHIKTDVHHRDERRNLQSETYI